MIGVKNLIGAIKWLMRCNLSILLSILFLGFFFPIHLFSSDLNEEWQTIQVTGSKDQNTRKVNVYLPKEYKNSSIEKLPVLYYFHGHSSGQNEVKHIPMKEMMSLARNSGIIKPFVVVAPELNNGFGLDSPKEGGLKSESFLIDDLMPQIERKFHLDGEKRMAMGNSMGGYVSLNLAAKYPGMFKGVVAHEPMLFESPIWLDEKKSQAHIQSMKKWNDLAVTGLANLREVLPSAESFEANNPIVNLPKTVKASGTKVFVSTGSLDDFKFDQGAIALKTNLTQAGDKDSKVYIREGDDHDYHVVAKGMVSGFLFLGKNQGGQTKTDFAKFLLRLEDENKLFPILSSFVNQDPLEGLSLLVLELKKSGLSLSPGELELLKNLMLTSNMPIANEIKDFIRRLKSLDFERDSTNQLKVNVKFYPSHCAYDEIGKKDCRRDRMLIPLSTSQAYDLMKDVLEKEASSLEDKVKLSTAADACLGCLPGPATILKEERSVKDVSSELAKSAQSAKSQVPVSMPYALDLDQELSFNLSLQKNDKQNNKSSGPAFKLTNIAGMKVLINAGDSFFAQVLEKTAGASVNVEEFISDGKGKRSVRITKGFVDYKIDL